MLFPDHFARYASIGGKPNPQQPELIRAAAARMPHGADVVAAMDADADGRKLAEIVKQAVALTGRGDLHFRMQEPEGAKDWSDLLRAKPLPFLPCAGRGPRRGKAIAYVRAWEQIRSLDAGGSPLPLPARMGFFCRLTTK